MFFDRKMELIQEPVLEKSNSGECFRYSCSSNSCSSNTVLSVDRNELDDIIESPTLRLGR